MVKASACSFSLTSYQFQSNYQITIVYTKFLERNPLVIEIKVYFCHILKAGFGYRRSRVTQGNEAP